MSREHHAGAPFIVAVVSEAFISIAAGKISSIQEGMRWYRYYLYRNIMVSQSAI
jgi:hypothetical protein